MWEILSYSMCNDQMYLQQHLYRSYLFWTWAAITSIYQDIEQDLLYLNIQIKIQSTGSTAFLYTDNWQMFILFF